MAVKALNDDMASAYKLIKALAAAVQQKAVSAKDRLLASSQSVYYYYDLVVNMQTSKDQIYSLLAMGSGLSNKDQIVAYIQSIEGDPEYDPEAEYSILIASMSAVVDEAIAAIPVDANGNISAEKFVDSTRVGSDIVPPSTLLDALDDLIASIE